ncbi:Uncharacterised protein [Sphingobacterium multivorum]|jgi:hypothetical protein|uniref:Uncharacterized protein n=1 Tax=Sphingobacterium multivorum TaxID=28454 RepID=A0A2X2IWY4_SPHMU|nr:Uncharacterised protein [Sphingobacterium multivorum]SUJ27644.1 Uncharacterised protein [Sphingobacterium multivorum]VXD05110.1 conserved hypothetical protein [Sphingobacterium multivorum]
MENIEKKAKKIGLEKGYYLLLMAILDLPVEEVQNTVKEG